MTVDISPKMKILSAEEEIVVETNQSFSDFVGVQYFKNPTVMQQGEFKSNNFVTGVSGWKIDADGNAEFQSVTAGAYIQVFVQAGIPTSLHINDIWYDSDDGNKPYRAAIVGADAITAGEWEAVDNPTEWANVGDGASTKPANSADVTSANSQAVQWLIAAIRSYTCFENSGRFDVTGVSGSGSIVFDNSGMRLETGTTAGSLALTKWFVCQEALKSSPVFSVVIEMANNVSNGLQAVFSLGEPLLSGTGFDPAGSHCGFFINKVSGVINLYALQNDGTGEVKTGVLTTIANGDVMDLILKMNGTTSVDYYWRKNGGALSAKTTVSTKVPDAKKQKATFGLNNFNQTGTNQIIVLSSSYER